MKDMGRLLWFGLGLIFGIAGTLLLNATSRPVLAFNDRQDDYILTTGPVMTGPVINNVLNMGGNGMGGSGPGEFGKLPLNGNRPGGTTTMNMPVTMGNYDGVWLLDYRAGKLLGTVVDSMYGKVANWAEVDLVEEFKIAPKQNVHFLMTTGTTINGRTPLYVAETLSGRFGVYTMSAPMNAQQGVMIRRHEATKFR